MQSYAPADAVETPAEPQVSASDDLGSGPLPPLARALADPSSDGNDRAGWGVTVTVEGVNFNFQLTEDDLYVVFGRYGQVTQVMVMPGEGSVAYVYFKNAGDAEAAIQDLNGKVLNGVQGRLIVLWGVYFGHGPMGSAPGGIKLPAVDPLLSDFCPPPTHFSGFHPDASPFSSDMGAIPPPAFGMQGGHTPSRVEAGRGPPPQQPHPRAYHRQRWEAAGGPGAAGAGALPMLPVPDEQPSVRKYTCRFEIQIENDKEFQVARRIIGQKGCNMKKIVRQTDAKLRLRGRGSGYLEGAAKAESPEPLHLCISCTTEEGYKQAVGSVKQLLDQVYEEYRYFCLEKGITPPKGLGTGNFKEHHLMSGAHGLTPAHIGGSSHSGGGIFTPPEPPMGYPGNPPPPDTSAAAAFFPPSDASPGEMQSLMRRKQSATADGDAQESGNELNVYADMVMMTGTTMPS